MIIKPKFIKILLLLILGTLGVQAQEGVVTISQDSDIDKLLEFKKDTKTLKIYKIQVFQSVDPDLAKDEKVKFLESYTDWPVEIHWNTPNYKVWVGNFTDRLEADRALKKIKTTYMNAIIFQPKED
jgi:hypothetical protein